MDIEEAYCLSDNKVYSALEFRSVIANLNNEEKNEFLKSLVCPYCKLSHCNYISSMYESHFSIKDGEKHAAGCPMLLNEYTQNEIKTNIELNHTEFILRAMNALAETYTNSTQNKASILPMKKTPQKRIDIPLRFSDSSKFQIYYGQLCVCFEQRENENLFVLKSTTEPDLIFCELSVPDSVCKNLPDEYKKCNGEEKFVCFFTEITLHGLNGNNESCLDYYQANLSNPSFLIIK